MSDLEFSDSGDEQSDNEIDSLFQQAANHVQHIHKQLPPTELLELYAYYKQATVGRCNTSKPNVLQMQSRSKWNAWHALGTLPAGEARRSYVQKVQQLDPDWAKESLSQMKPPISSWVVHSTLQQARDPDDLNQTDSEKNAFDWVREGNLMQLRACFAAHDADAKAQLLQQLDEHGMGLVHWATDRNQAQLLEFLLQQGADVNQRDTEQQTPLHYASSCGHGECLSVLLKHKADSTLCDADGQTCIDVAENADMRALIQNATTRHT